MTITQEKIRSIVMQRLNQDARRLSIIVNKCNNVMLHVCISETFFEFMSSENSYGSSIR